MRLPRPRGWLPLFGLLAYLVFLVAGTPASWLAYAVDRGSQDHVLLLNMHHIVTDGWSMGLLFHELSTLYQAFSSDSPSCTCQGTCLS